MTQIVVHHDRVAGHHFNGKADLRVSFHCERIDSAGNILERGYFVGRKWLENRNAFNYCPTMGWAKEHWFEWPKSRQDFPVRGEEPEK